MSAAGTAETEISTPKAPYLDTFTGDVLDPFWMPSGDGTNVSMAQANGELEFDFAAEYRPWRPQ